MALNGSVFNLGAAMGGALGGLFLEYGGYMILGAGLPAFALAAALLAALCQPPATYADHSTAQDPRSADTS